MTGEQFVRFAEASAADATIGRLIAMRNKGRLVYALCMLASAFAMMNDWLAIFSGKSTYSTMTYHYVLAGASLVCMASIVVFTVLTEKHFKRTIAKVQQDFDRIVCDDV